MTPTPPFFVLVKVLFWGGEAWQHKRVLRWTDQGPVVGLDGEEFLPAPDGWATV